MKIKDIPKQDRPREKLIEKGPENLKDEELLAILINTGTKGKSAIEIARQILQKHTKKNLLSLKHEDLSKVDGIGSAKACVILASQELIKRALEVRDESLPKINSVQDVLAQAVYMRDKSREHLMALFLNARNEMIWKKSMFVGTLNANLVHPREIFQVALEKNAGSVILAHNHPSGDNEPSEDDLLITKRLQEAGKLMGVEIIDHVIIAKGKPPYSFKENKLI